MRLALLVVLAGCAGTTAEAPLTVSLGLPRADAERALREHQYCHTANPPTAEEMFPRCDRPGTEWGESWVTARFDGDTLVELKRWERFTDDARATERWNQLVMARAKVSPESPEAIAALRDKGLLEAGTRTVKAFRVGADTIVGVYLLTPTEPQQANVLEAIVRSPKP
jgi:hypothetical protein